jgi:hypothetical protein
MALTAQSNLYDLLSPYGWAHMTAVVDPGGSRLDIKLTLRCEDCENTVTAIRAHLTGQALAALTALEAAGAEVYSTEITLTPPPIAGKLRAEVSDIWR